jgi:predicted signal transduction protein with EAL and GGDEF domain
LERNELLLHYQPMVDMASGKLACCRPQKWSHKLKTFD